MFFLCEDPSYLVGSLTFLSTGGSHLLLNYYNRVAI